MPIQLVNGYVLLPAPADWSDGAEILLQWQSEIAAAQRGNEDRASLRPLPQAQVAWRVVTDTPEEGADLETCVRAALRSGRACAPCYARPTYTRSFVNGTRLSIQPTQWPWAVGDHLFTLGPDSAVYIAQVTALNGAEMRLSAPIPLVGVIWPVVFGRLEVETPEQEAPDTLLVGLRLHVGQWKLPTASAAPAIYGGTPIVPPVLVTDWSDPVERAWHYDAAVEQIGYGAETSEGEQSYVQHGVTMTTVLQTDSAISDVEAFVGSLGGRRGNFWLPAHERAMLITSGQDTSTFSIKAQGLAATWNSQPGQSLYFHKEGQPPMAARIGAVAAVDATTERVTLTAALPVVLDDGWDVYRLRLMRLADDELRESYEADGLCTIRASAVECPLEYYTAALGARRAFLYRFTAMLLDEPVEWLRTSHAQAITVGGETWLPLPISHGEISRSMESTDESATLTTQFSADNPLAQFLPFPPSFRMRATILCCDLASPDVPPEVEFTGFVCAPNLIGRKIEAKVQCPVDFLDGKAPNFYIGYSCNARLYRSPGCNLNEADWRTDGQIAALGGVGLALTVNPGKPANYYAMGHLTVGSGVNTERRTIMRSNGVSLVLNYPLLKTAVGATVAIYPGCAHTPDDCKNKFHNYVNYRGQPLVPHENPTLHAIDANNTGGKK